MGGFWYLMPLSPIFQLCCGCQFYWWRKRNTRRKAPTCHKLLTNLMLYQVSVEGIISLWQSRFTRSAIITISSLCCFPDYTVEREHSGLRALMSYGISITRGAAAVMSFTFSLLLLTMCRNIITWLRGTFLNLHIPFDSHVAFHKVVAWTALFFTGMISMRLGWERGGCIGYAPLPKWVSEWVLFNADSAIFQLYHGENKLIFTETLVRR